MGGDLNDRLNGIQRVQHFQDVELEKSASTLTERCSLMNMSVAGTLERQATSGTGLITWSYKGSRPACKRHTHFGISFEHPVRQEYLKIDQFL